MLPVRQHNSANFYFFLLIAPSKLDTDVPIAGGHLNIKMSSYQYRDPFVKDKTVSRLY